MGETEKAKALDPNVDSEVKLKYNLYLETQLKG